MSGTGPDSLHVPDEACRDLDPQELRDSVRDYRNPATSQCERSWIVGWWAEHGIPNQFAAMLRAAKIEKGDREPLRCSTCEQAHPCDHVRAVAEESQR